MKTRTNRKHNTGTLEKVRNIYHIRYTDKTTGKRLRISTGLYNRREAEAYLDKWAAERKLTQEIGDDTQRLYHLKARLEHQLSDNTKKLSEMKAIPIDGLYGFFSMSSWFKGLSTSSHTNMRVYLRHFSEWTTKRISGNEPVLTSQITKEIAKEYIESIPQEKSLDAQRRILGFMRLLFSRLIEKGVCLENPFEGIKFKGHLNPVKKRMLTDDEIVKLKTVLKSKPLETQVLFTLGMYTGQRFGDCRKMKWSFIKTEGNERFFKFMPSKTKKYGTKVTVPICDELWTMIDKMEKTSDFILPRLSLMTKSKANHSVCKIFDEAGIERTDENGNLVVGFHSLRHTFVSKLANSGKPLTVIRSMVGHTADDMTEYYTHTTLDAQRNAISALSASMVDTETITLPKQFVEMLDRRRKDMPMEDFLKQLLWEHDNCNRDTIFV